MDKRFTKKIQQAGWSHEDYKSSRNKIRTHMLVDIIDDIPDDVKYDTESIK